MILRQKQDAQVEKKFWFGKKVPIPDRANDAVSFGLMLNVPVNNFSVTEPPLPGYYQYFFFGGGGV